jgi:hypothetical protein
MITSLVRTIQQGETRWRSQATHLQQRSFSRSVTGIRNVLDQFWWWEGSWGRLHLRFLRHDDRYTKGIRCLNAEININHNQWLYRINIRPTRQRSLDRRRSNCTDPWMYFEPRYRMICKDQRWAFVQGSSSKQFWRRSRVVDECRKPVEWIKNEWDEAETKVNNRVYNTSFLEDGQE